MLRKLASSPLHNGVAYNANPPNSPANSPAGNPRFFQKLPSDYRVSNPTLTERLGSPIERYML
jgi:hypothetical protein